MAGLNEMPVRAKGWPKPAAIDNAAPRVIDASTDDMPGSVVIGLRGRVWRGWWYVWHSPRVSGAWCGWVRRVPYAPVRRDA